MQESASSLLKMCVVCAEQCVTHGHCLPWLPQVNRMVRGNSERTKQGTSGRGTLRAKKRQRKAIPRMMARAVKRTEGRGMRAA
eukprot:103976-Pleurochrysis_carterae.AAC.1